MNWYSFLKKTVNYPCKLFFRVKVEGKENEPAYPYIVCGNHSSYLDPVLVAIALKANPVWIGKRELLNHAFMRWLFRVTGTIPIKREGFDTAALRKCVSTVKNGNVLGIFPQGTRMRGVDPVPSQAHAGLALIAETAKAAVLPVSIVTRARQPKLFSKTRIIIHKPISYDEYMGISEHPTKKDITEYIFSRVCDPFTKQSEPSDA